MYYRRRLILVSFPIAIETADRRRPFVRLGGDQPRPGRGLRVPAVLPGGRHTVHVPAQHTPRAQKLPAAARFSRRTGGS